MTSTITYDKDGNARTFAGTDAVNVYALHVLASGLRMYAQHGIMPNRACSPSAMMKAASRWTKKTYKRGQYMEAAKDLVAMADEIRRMKVEVHHEPRS